MFTVTDTATQKFEELTKTQVQNQEEADDKFIRLVPSQEGQDKLELVLDEEREDDQVVQAEDGTKVLLVSNELSNMLDGMVLDYKESGEGAGFLMERRETE